MTFRVLSALRFPSLAHIKFVKVPLGINIVIFYIVPSLR